MGWRVRAYSLQFEVTRIPVEKKTKPHAVVLTSLTIMVGADEEVGVSFFFNSEDGCAVSMLCVCVCVVGGRGAGLTFALGIFQHFSYFTLQKGRADRGRERKRERGGRKNNMRNAPNLRRFSDTCFPPSEQTSATVRVSGRHRGGCLD